MDFTRLLSITPEKTLLFIITTVKTSDQPSELCSDIGFCVLLCVHERERERERLPVCSSVPRTSNKEHCSIGNKFKIYIFQICSLHQLGVL
jgi:hypothetical protein